MLITREIAGCMFQPVVGYRRRTHHQCRVLGADTQDSGRGPQVIAKPQPDNIQLSHTPLVDAVRRRGDAVHEAPFHVPGHKRGASAPEPLVRLVRPPRGSFLQYDLTEVAGLDFLSSPSGVIREAQDLAAEAFGADHTWFLVNGCSVGIHAAVVAVTAGQQQGQGGGNDAADPGVLLVARNCHLSAFSAMVVAGCEPHWLQPEVDPRVGVAHCVTPGSVRSGLEQVAARGRRAVGVLVVSPTYYGAVADIEGIAAACHSHGVPLLVDEAHGGHFAFLPGALENGARSDSPPAGPPHHPEEPPCCSSATPPPPPPPALRCGADVVMQSTHKVLGAMTQAAMLHLRGPRVSPARVGRALQTLQTSSPSYLLMSSLDAARAQAAAGGAFEEPVAAAQLIREAVSRCSLVELLDERTAGSAASVRAFDPLRLTLLVDRLRLPGGGADGDGGGGGGFAAAEWLERRHGVVPELATAKTVVLALGPGSTREHARVAARAIQDLDRQGAAGADESGHIADSGARRDDPAPHQPALGASAEVVMTPREAFFARSVSVPADAAVGRVSAELLCPYPPGVPLLFPGERISGAALAALRDTLAAGGAVTGARDGTLRCLEVVALPGE